MMSVYRELKDGEFDTTELDVHLERCASCRQALARDAFIGDQLRTLPVIEPPPDMHAKLMRAIELLGTRVAPIVRTALASETTMSPLLTDSQYKRKGSTTNMVRREVKTGR